jgi:hypothetical protein
VDYLRGLKVFFVLFLFLFFGQRLSALSRSEGSWEAMIERAAINYAKAHPRLSVTAGVFCISGLLLVSYLNSLRYTIPPVIGLNQARGFAEMLSRARLSSGYVRS